MHRSVPVEPIPLPCATYRGRTRCEADAVVWLIQPDGEPNPGGYVCRPHGEAVVSEYREKLGEGWSLVEIPRSVGGGA